jgi:hypothetical protein
MYTMDKIAHGLTGGSSLLKLKLCVFSYLRLFNDAFSIENVQHGMFSYHAPNVTEDSPASIKMDM